ncbi:MAG: hypothetical protein ACRCU1_00440 [Alsobacter sp.]
MTQFLRNVRLTIWKPEPGEDSGFGAYFGDPIPNSTVITDLRIQFSVEKDDKTTSNKASISVTNLAKSTRADLAQLPRRMILEAGYNGKLSVIFTGDVTTSPGSTDDGIDTITTLLGKDGGRAIKHARINKSYRGATSVFTAAQGVIAAMGLREPENLALYEELQAQYPHGVTLYGQASDNLSQLLAPYKLGWSIQNGRLRIAKATETTPGTLILDAAAGMIGSPEVSPPDKPGGKLTIAARFLLFPELEPGSKADLRSKNFTGTIKIKAVKHNGDNMGGDMLTEIEAVPSE